MESENDGWKTVRHDIQILKDMSSMPIKDVHSKYYPKRNPVEAAMLFNNLLQALKERNKRARWRLNNVNVITKRSFYVKKRLIIPEKIEEDELLI